MKTYAPRALQAFVAAVVAATLLLFLASGEIAIAVAPLAALIVLLLLASASPRRLALSLFFAVLVLDNPKENPFTNRWKSPLSPLGTALFDNLNELTGVAPLRFSLLDLSLFGLLALVTLRRDRGSAAGGTRLAERRIVPIPKPIGLAMLVMLAGVAWLETYGMLRGGNFKNSLWQFREIGWIPGVAYIFAQTVRGPRDHAVIARAVVLAAVVKSIFALWFFFVVMRPQGIRPAHATTHQDTLVFVGASLVVLVVALEERTGRSIRRALALMPLFLLAIMVNNRRLAYIELIGGLLAVWVTMPRGPAVRRLERRMLIAAPFVALYLAAGWSSGNFVFTPAHKIASLFSKDDRSAGSRDVENYNLTLNMKAHPLLGTGFGHEYFEFSHPDSIKEIFPLYRYIGHNSVLWLFAVGGLVGFALIWTALVVIVFFGARAYRVATTPSERAAAMLSICAVLVYAVQSYGDMGFVSWNGVFLVAMASAVAGKLCVAEAAWPHAVAAKHAHAMGGAAWAR